jgi:hypothetical protein
MAEADRQLLLSAWLRFFVNNNFPQCGRQSGAVRPALLGFAGADRMKISLFFHIDEISGGQEKNYDSGI